MKFVLPFALPLLVVGAVSGQVLETLGLDTEAAAWQRNASVGKMIAVDAGETAHLVWMSGVGPLRRAMVACVDVGAELPELIAGPANLIDQHSGYPAVAVTGPAPENGLAPNSTVAALHTAVPATTWFCVDAATCSMDIEVSRDEAAPGELLWPQVAVDYLDRLHLICSDVGQGQVRYTASSDGNAWEEGWSQL
jgi:hypothetical protein